MEDGLVPANRSSIDPSTDLISQIHIGVIIAVTLVVATIFLAVYVQLMLVICYGYKLVSYQTVFLFNILLWSSLRLTLYSFYYYHCCELANNLPSFPNWLLLSAPSIFLFLSLALLVHYFMEHLVKVFERRQEVFYLNPSYRTIHLSRLIGTGLWILSLVLFITINIVLGLFLNIYTNSPDMDSDSALLTSLRLSRVIVLEGLLLLMGLALGIFIIVIYGTRAGKDIMESKQVSKKQAIAISSFLILLFSSRAIYNIVTVAIQSSHISPFGYSNTFSTNMADFDGHTKEGDIVYFCVLLLWEVIPICLIVLFFRIRRPSTLKLLNSHSSDCNGGASRHFFNYSNGSSFRSSLSAGASLLRSSHVSIPSLPNPPYSSRGNGARTLGGGGGGGYGSTTSNANKNHYSAPTKYSINGGSHSFMPGTTPPQLFTGSPTLFGEIQTRNA